MFFTNSINEVVSNKKKTRNLIKNMNRLQTNVHMVSTHLLLYYPLILNLWTLFFNYNLTNV